MGSWVWWVSLWVAAYARELDPAGCAARFDVQRDKIIRTEESRSMGARYLSELDVGSRHECLRLCCETDSCDVFVFEEKSPGSCYLFNCGPPEDFRCKFTAHGNFSSGVLALSRRLAELQDQERLVHHEQELASLRSHTTTTVATTVTTTRSTERPPRPEPPAPPPQPQQQTSRCSRYQFECRHGGECIAVYNACDGVPQCADGSDEAPELGCPAPPTHPPPQAPHTQPTQPPPPPVVQPQMQVAVQESGEEAASELWPHRLTQAQPPYRYNAGNNGGVSGSHIFSHTGGLVQESAFEPPSPNGPWPHRSWQQAHVPQAANDGMDDRVWDNYGRGRMEWPEVESRRAWPVPQPRPEPDMPLYMPPKAMPELPMVYSSQQQTLRDSPKKGFELAPKSQHIEYATEPPRPATPAPPQNIQPPEVHKPVPIENATKKKVLKEIMADTNKVSRPAEPPRAEAKVHEHFTDEHDGLSEHSPAAVLLLVLGTLMTAALGGLLACRARASRRRRGRPRLAMDSDYLVNGMYL
ncbi:formin-like protein 7 isoform X2 [Aricia agestis]|uniref:formin-like protein 7 isoform X2 n=1 Tax=Aricia agestis TaxID=91739 RepID=UPI001C2091DD|nr:formin-like protein 7 isoform X2 [Aricia agestis]